MVAPYNAQVRRLIESLPANARVGTVDKFQGQDLLYLTTVGAKAGQKRHTTVARAIPVIRLSNAE